MIITEDIPKSPVKATTPLLAGPGGSSVPPPYAPREPGPTPVGATLSYSTTDRAVYGQLRRQSAARRFFVAFLVALGIWLLLSTLLGSIVDLANGGMYSAQIREYGSYPIPAGVTLDECVSDAEWAQHSAASGSYPYSATTTFELPVPAETLLLLSHGALSAGNLKVSTSPELINTTRVHVTVQYYSVAVRRAAKVCAITRASGEAGVGIFTPTNWRQRSRTDRLFFTVELVLPSAAAPLYINALSTDVSNFSHDLDPLMGIIKFGAVALKGSNGHIDIKTLSAEDATLTTSNGYISAGVLAAPSAMVRSSNGGISGTFNTSALLDLRTSNGAIAAAVGVDGSASTSAHPARVMLRTSNNALQSTLDLHTSTNSGGVFALTADTSNGRLDTHIASLPADSTLRAAARTSNARALLALPRAFEGAFSAQTSNAQPSVQRGEEEPDPAGRGRRRVVETQMVGKREVRGNVYWERGNRARGEASVRTSNGGVTIIL